MTPADALALVVAPTCRWLAARTGKPLDTPEAWAMLLAIAGQETGFQHRRQVSAKKPALGWPQFELGTYEPRAGLMGLMAHEGVGRTACEMAECLMPGLKLIEVTRVKWAMGVAKVYAAIEHNDVLAFGMARLLLWTVSAPLPLRDQPAEGWRQYAQEAWRPGRPHPETWRRHWDAAWAAVDEAQRTGGEG